VSIIIPVYGQCEYTLRCLLSIVASQPKIPYEVIVVDDHSPDESYAILQQVAGIQFIHNEVNQGFIRSCNIGSKLAKGQYVYFLNNDTQVIEGWLDELVDTFRTFPGTGLAGSKLVYPDGTLQEAGGIIWQDGSAWNFGRNQDPMLPIYNYAREVDFCSGASIMVPKALFDELGGFDEYYLPAYCEDADLALKIRDRGYRVIYQPLSTVVHFEGITSGTDTTKGVKAYQVENLKKLFQRWQGRLEMHQPNGVDVDGEKDRSTKRRVLVLDHCTPTPEHDAGSVIIINMLLLLREMGFQVTFIPEDNFLHMDEHTPALQRAGIEVLYAPYLTSVNEHLKEYGERYELVLVVRPLTFERNIQAIRRYCPQARVLFHTVDLHYLRMSREAELHADAAKQSAADEMKKREFAIIREADAAIVVSTVELEIIGPDLPGCKIFVFPLIMDVPGTEVGFSARRDIVFVGGYQHIPNVDAVKYFASAIMPLLRERLPGVRFHVVGSKAPADILDLAGEDVVVVGFVEDLNSLLHKMRVSVVPLRYGAGIKGKVGSAMAVGLPIVATSIAAEGMSLRIGENLLVEDDPVAFAAAVARLYEDGELWSSISETSIKFAEKEWGAEAAWNRLATILAALDIETARSERPLSLYSAKGQ
jgi:GT2 family glycosyltransferase/glycosyltransferase involved in cell wall biosynthesis